MYPCAGSEDSWRLVADCATKRGSPVGTSAAQPPPQSPPVCCGRNPFPLWPETGVARELPSLVGSRAVPRRTLGTTCLFSTVAGPDRDPCVLDRIPAPCAAWSYEVVRRQLCDRHMRQTSQARGISRSICQAERACSGQFSWGRVVVRGRLVSCEAHLACDPGRRWAAKMLTWRGAYWLKARRRAERGSSMLSGRAAPRFR